MIPIRIHLGPMPEMLRTIVNDLLWQEPDIVVVGQSENHEDPFRCALEERAQVMITQESVGGGTTCLDAILSAPPLSIFTISADGHDVASVSLVRSAFALNCDRKGMLAVAIRQAATNLSALSTRDGQWPA